MAHLASIRQMSKQVSRGSPGEYHADEQAGVTGKLKGEGWGISKILESEIL